MNDKLPNYYDVLISAWKCFPKPSRVAVYPYTILEEATEAPDAETAVPYERRLRLAGIRPLGFV